MIINRLLSLTFINKITKVKNIQIYKQTLQLKVNRMSKKVYKLKREIVFIKMISGINKTFKRPKNILGRLSSNPKRINKSYLNSCIKNFVSHKKEP